jgi:hypothetical protein
VGDRDLAVAEIQPCRILEFTGADGLEEGLVDRLLAQKVGVDDRVEILLVGGVGVENEETWGVGHDREWSFDVSVWGAPVPEPGTGAR